MGVTSTYRARCMRIACKYDDRYIYLVLHIAISDFLYFLLQIHPYRTPGMPELSDFNIRLSYELHVQPYALQW